MATRSISSNSLRQERASATMRRRACCKCRTARASTRASTSRASSLGSASFQFSSDGAGGTFVTTAADNDGSPEPPALTIANTSPTVAAGGSISLGVTATPADSDDAVSVTISGVPSYETISAPTGDSVAHQTGSSTWTISSTAGVPITGLTLTSNYTGTGHPVAALSVTASNTTTGETASSASQTINVTDPPAVTSTSPPSPTTNSGAGRSTCGVIRPVRSRRLPQRARERWSGRVALIFAERAGGFDVLGPSPSLTSLLWDSD